MKSNTKSASIRDIESKYNINLTTCTRCQLDLLTSKHNENHPIKSISDLMLNARQFDIANMTDTERANLKYLVMSTDEIINILGKKSKSIYYKPRNTRLRFLMSYTDFYQICAYKLLLNDGILKFNANYKLDPAMHCWFTRVAGWKCKRRANIADEITILDKPCNDDTDTTVGDLILKDETCEIDGNAIDSDLRVNKIMSEMNKTPVQNIIIKAIDTAVPFSEFVFAELFVKYGLGKKELSKMLYNTVNNKLVSNQTFNKLYKKMILHIAEIINREYNEVGESFSINEDDL